MGNGSHGQLSTHYFRNIKLGSCDGQVGKIFPSTQICQRGGMLNITKSVLLDVAGIKFRGTQM
jgi:hypothetical protein